MRYIILGLVLCFSKAYSQEDNLKMIKAKKYFKWQDNKWSSTNSIFFSYDHNGRIIRFQEVQYSKNGKSNILYIDTTIYRQEGKVTVKETWSKGNINSVYKKKYKYTYDSTLANAIVKIEYSSNDNEWQNQIRQVTSISDKQTIVVNYAWNFNKVSWDTTDFVITQHDIQGNIKEIKYYTKANEENILIKKIIYNYETSVSFVEEIYEKEFDGDSITVLTTNFYENKRIVRSDKIVNRNNDKECSTVKYFYKKGTLIKEVGSGTNKYEITYRYNQLNELIEKKNVADEYGHVMIISFSEGKKIITTQKYNGKVWMNSEMEEIYY